MLVVGFALMLNFCLLIMACMLPHLKIAAKQPLLINTVETGVLQYYTHLTASSRRTWVSQYQKGKTSVNLSEARDDGDGSGISKQSTPRFRQTTTLASLNFFARWMLFLMSNQQCQRTEGTHTHTFNGNLSRTTRVGRYQKGKTNLDFTEARDSEWQWHQLGHMQVCTSLQADNHASTHRSVFYRPDALPAAQPTASKH